MTYSRLNVAFGLFVVIRLLSQTIVWHPFHIMYVSCNSDGVAGKGTVFATLSNLNLRITPVQCFS